jgi:hypothetical protein
MHEIDAPNLSVVSLADALNAPNLSAVSLADDPNEQGKFTPLNAEPISMGLNQPNRRNGPNKPNYGPSCLIYGVTGDGKILHVQCSTEPVWIVTAYDPTVHPEEWEREYRRRRTRS